MCTLSLFRTPDGYRVFMNRDERHERAEEKPPQKICDDHSIFGPLDPKSEGTWIAHNDQGFWGCLLNGYFEQDQGGYEGKKTRGQILPFLLRQDQPLQAIEDLDASEYPSFRLLIGSHDTHRLFVWDGERYSEEEFHASHNDQSFFLSSSSWNQNEVIDIRKALFKNWVEEHSAPNGSVPEFHYTQVPNPESAPLMYRSYARTKSITALDITPDTIEMSYWLAPDDFQDIGTPVLSKIKR